MKKSLELIMLIFALLAVMLLSFTACTPKECEHEYSNEITKDATCVTDGIMTYTCTLCGDSYTEAINKLGHDEIAHEAKAPTCTEKGWDAHAACSRCDYTTTYTEHSATGIHSVLNGACSMCNALESTPGLEYELNEDGMTYTVTGIGNCTETDIVIGIYNNHSVTTIGSSAFPGGNSLTSVTIGDSVTTIGSSAFSDCTSLTSITISDNVTTIGDWAFLGCTRLTSITIPDSVTSIGNYAFLGCTRLTSITIPDSVTSIGSYAFCDCTSLTIYFEAASQPIGLSPLWNSSNRPVVWGYKGD